MGLISRQVPFLLGTATGAYSLENVVDIVDLEVTWQRHHWHMDAAQAGGAMAALTIEVGVQVVEMLAFLTTVATAVAHGIFYSSCSIVDGMDEMVGKEQSDAAIDGGLVDRVETLLKAEQREGLVALKHSA